MAKLSAHGNERARFELLEGPTDSVLARRIRYSVRADGAILKEYSVLFPKGEFHPGGWHSYGWKIAARPKVARPLDNLRPALIQRGFMEV
jgi:hypothetical protein